MDLTMAGGGGIKAIERMRQACPQVRVLVLTMHDDLAYLRSALAAGGSGYVVKKAADSELLSAIRAVYRGHMFVDLASGGTIAQDALANPASRDAARQGGAKTLLSQREQEVLVMLAQGSTYQQIADHLHLSVKTVETYRSRIAEKLELHGRADVVRYALQIGIQGPEIFTQNSKAL
jgi:DNA-binding NarL/FixJ family response regulator